MCYGQPSMVVHGDSFFFFLVFSSIDKIPPQQPVQSVVVWKMILTSIPFWKTKMEKANPILDVISEHDDFAVILNPESHSFPTADRWMVKFTNSCLTFFDPYSKIISCVMGFPLGPRHWIIKKLTTHQFRFFCQLYLWRWKAGTTRRRGKCLNLNPLYFKEMHGGQPWMMCINFPSTNFF